MPLFVVLYERTKEENASSKFSLFFCFVSSLFLLLLLLLLLLFELVLLRNVG